MGITYINLYGHSMILVGIHYTITSLCLSPWLYMVLSMTNIDCDGVCVCNKCTCLHPPRTQQSDWLRCRSGRGVGLAGMTPLGPEVRESEGGSRATTSNFYPAGCVATSFILALIYILQHCLPSHQTTTSYCSLLYSKWLFNILIITSCGFILDECARVTR